jgi:probable phosphomutase (TIGR03848 family)
MSRPATIVIVRHATTASTGRRLGGRTDTELDDFGRQQAEAVGRRLAELPVRAVYSSPLPRCRQTAEAVAGPHRLDVACDEGLLEVDYGAWTDRPLKPLVRTRLWPVIQDRPSLVRFPDGEALRGMQLRMVDAVERLAARHGGRVIAVVSHGDPIKAAVAFYLGLPLDLFQRLHVAPASVTVVQVGGGTRPLLLRLNDDGPLDGRRFPPASRRSRGEARRG